MFEGQPKGLYALALANTGERFGYYTMLAVLCFSSKPISVGMKEKRVLFTLLSWHLSISCLL